MHTDIGSLSPGQLVDDVYLMRECQLRTAKNGKYYLHVGLVDKTGQISGRLWTATEALFKAVSGASFVRVQVRVEVYQDSLQLNVSSIRPESMDRVVPADFLPSTPKNVEEMFAKLLALADSLANPHLRALVRSVLDDPELSARFKKAPAATSYHQAYLGGLLEHTLAVTELADLVAARYAGLNRDLFISGAILHDLGKIEELRYEKGFDYSDRGKLIGHLIIAVQMLQERVKTIDGFPPHLFDLLSHLILSHHGEYEFGSPKLPMTAEAIALHHLDNLDAKIDASLRAIESNRLTEGNWTEFSRMFQRQLYRGPRDANEPVD
jgi:3'-5' exoribonuclease